MAVRYGSKSTIAASHRKPWRAVKIFKGVRWYGPLRATEREAAIDYDRHILELGLDLPLNILKRKPQ